MTRRDLLRALPVCAASVAGRAQVIAYRPYERCLPDTMRRFAAEAVARRDAEIARLTSPAAIRSRQQWAREMFWRLAGGTPERTPLNLRVTGGFERDKYRVEHLLYESRPGEWITANLYIPKSGSKPFPGVLFQMGHSPNGKASDTYQRCCQGLVQLGFVVLAFDPMGQGERTNYPGPDGLTRLPSTDDEHTVPGRQMLLVGETATRMQVWDAVRSLDVLASHPLVDATRLASAGQSGGGTLTMMLAAVDDRLAVAAVSSGNTENVACATFHPPGSVDDAEQNFIGSGAVGFDRWDLLWPFAPKPLLILVSAKDSFGTYSPSYEANGVTEYARLKAGYALLGHADRIDRVEAPLPHGLSYSLRLNIYRWLGRWLMPGAPHVLEEPPVMPEPDRFLQASKTGNVVRDFASKTPFAVVAESARRIRTPSAPDDLRKLLGMEPPLSSRPQFRILSTVPSRDCEILAVEVQSARAVWIPAWLFVPKQASRLLIIVEPYGRNVRWREGDLYQGLAAKGTLVCAPDLRGIGDLRPEFSSGAADYTRDHQSEENYAWASLIFGHSLLGQRVTDLLAVVEAASAQAGLLPMVAARGQLTIPALCAAFLHSGIQALYLKDHLSSWRSLVETADYLHPFANFVPDVLRHTDLPQLAAAIAPRKVTMEDSWDISALSRF